MLFLRRFALLSACFAFVIGAYAYGIETGLRHLWPYPQFKSIKEHLLNKPLQFDSYGRLTRYPGKEEIACPAQDARTAVLFAFGQSNSSNNGGQRYRAVDDRVVNFFGGHCYRAASPLLGGENIFGEPWTLLGNKLVESGRFDRVVIISTGIGGSSVSDWAAGGRLNQVLGESLDGARPQYRITHVLWHQGERDFADGTGRDAYMLRFRSVLATLQEHGVTSPVFLCRVSVDGMDGPRWTQDNPVRQAQAALIDGKTVLAGPDTDLLLTDADRYDGTHFAASGEEKFVAGWMQVIK